ncbi:MAG: hypothetical protein ACXAC5_03920 [Promethearchaeota archaeon]
MIITIANRDDHCKDCKLTIECKVKTRPSWWRRFFLREVPVDRIKVDVWYGHDNQWSSSSTHRIRPPIGKAIYFSRIWRHHVTEKNRLEIKGPYKSIIDSRTGVRDGFKTQGKDQKAGGGARIVKLNDYRASQDSEES